MTTLLILSIKGKFISVHSRQCRNLNYLKCTIVRSQNYICTVTKPQSLNKTPLVFNQTKDKILANQHATSLSNCPITVGTAGCPFATKWQENSEQLKMYFCLKSLNNNIYVTTLSGTTKCHEISCYCSITSLFQAIAGLLFAILTESLE